MTWLKQNWFRTTLAVIIVISVFFIFSNYSSADVYVNGYYRSNGTYVNGYYRSSPDSNPYNNYSYPGNYNPYTGVTAPGNPDTYLRNYYGGSSGGSSGGSYYHIPTPTPTPSCPLMSSYNSISGTCQCYSGYVTDGSSCVSGLSYCWDKYGYNSSYNSLKKSCECDSGYELKYGTCTRIQKATNLNYPLYYPTPTPTPTCNNGYLLRSGQCITHTQDCINNFGPNVSGVKGDGNNSSCSCSPGYSWNTSRTACAYQTPVPTPTVTAAPSIPRVLNFIAPTPISCANSLALSLDKKRCIKLPKNSHVTNDGKNVWLCDSGYTEKGNFCILDTSISTPIPTPVPTITPKSNKSFWSKLKFW